VNCGPHPDAAYGSQPSSALQLTRQRREWCCDPALCSACPTCLDESPRPSDTSSMTSQAAAGSRALSWPRLSLGHRGWVVVLTMFAALVLGGASYVVGTHHRGAGTHVATGYAYASPLQISAVSNGWSYEIPLHVRWLGSVGGWHEGSRPACLPASTARTPAKFGWVSVRAPGPGDVSWRAVVWVDCR
jgi:hypothetical protein